MSKQIYVFLHVNCLSSQVYPPCQYNLSNLPLLTLGNKKILHVPK